MRSFPTVLTWTGRALRLLDQTRLPAEEVHVNIRSVPALIDALQRLVVRGAPAIGCAGAYGVVLAAREAARAPRRRRRSQFDGLCRRLAAARPTAVNLRWAVGRCRNVAHGLASQGRPVREVVAAVLAEARAIHAEDRAMCERIGRYGAALLPARRATVITHCNAGALATGGAGTALAALYEAHAAGTRLTVFADETRPLLQGARLTAWELTRAGIEVIVICDNMAAQVMQSRRVDAVIVGADRIAANGDTANKIGSYGLAVLARHHRVPFYVAAPSSTFDLSLPDGARIPIEQRPAEEIIFSGRRPVAPPAAKVHNPAFDVTPARLITAIITEKGVLRPPYRRAIAELIGSPGGQRRGGARGGRRGKYSPAKG